MLWLCLWSVFIRGHEVSEENVVVIYVLVCVSFLQARQQAQMRHQMASDSKSEYAAYLEKFNKEQNEHYYTIIPNIFQVHITALQCMICHKAGFGSSVSPLNRNYFLFPRENINTSKIIAFFFIIFCFFSRNQWLHSNALLSCEFKVVCNSLHSTPPAGLLLKLHFCHAGNTDRSKQSLFKVQLFLSYLHLTVTKFVTLNSLFCKVHDFWALPFPVLFGLTIKDSIKRQHFEID